ncbi:Exonuclease mut-7 [Phytophthora cinnamomi]|uniref:Exonuclease mut-7 n=1 Tax=Phytophthora cinnamomi TaxID=4785 RepID=UPI00355A83CA|nr:Exonuclease mut-7 [Phytophthora cinnamomi]
MSSDDVPSRLPSVLCMPKVVRDLLWTVTSPHMLSGDRFPVLPPEFGMEALESDAVVDWLNALVSDPTPLLAFLRETTSNGRSLALGVYFSTLLEYWLRFCPHLGMEKMEIGKQIVSESVGLLVKSIALLIRKGKQLNTPRRISHAVAVLPLNRSIDMQALGSLLGVNPEDIALADQETLVRVFGYSRGCLGPIGLREQQAMQIILDDAIKSEDYLLCGAGETDEVYAIAPDVLVKTVHALVAKITK